MLLTRQKRKPPRPLLNMAAMIDMVFLLLIFFMCTSAFRLPDRDLSARLPERGPAAAAAEELDPVRVRLTAGGPAARITCDGQPCADVDALVSMLAARRALGDPPVIIQGEPAVPFGQMVAALDACHRASLHRVAFSAQGTGP